MRWLLVSAQHHPTHGGIGTYVSRFTSAAADAGWRVDLMTRPSGLLTANVNPLLVRTPDCGPEFEARIPTLRQLELIRPYRYALWSRAVAERLLTLDVNYDAIEFVDTQAEGYGSLLSRTVRRRFAGVPMIVHAHTPMFVEEEINGADSRRFGRTIYHQWEKDALQAADGVIVTSRILAQRLPSRPNVSVIPYPIAPTDIEVMAKGSHDSEIILLIGSAQTRKGVETWARSLNALFHRRPNSTAILAGPDTPTGPGGTSMVVHVQQLIGPQHADRFQWTGPVSHDEILRLIDLSSVVVVPSVFESFSFAAAEALERGRPVIVSDHVGIIEYVGGLPVFKAGDAASLAEAQVAVLSNPRAAIARALESRQHMLETCAPQRHIQRRTSFIESVKQSVPLSGVELLRPNPESDLDAFVASVEHAEQSAAVASSPRS